MMESTHESNLSGKVLQLEQKLKTFQAEVDMKMKIMEQILNIRNEQFVVQKKLLDREHALYESVLSHWKNTAQLAQSGLSLHFSEGSSDASILINDSATTGFVPNFDQMTTSPVSSVDTPVRRASKRKLPGKATVVHEKSEHDRMLGADFIPATQTQDTDVDMHDTFENEESDMEGEGELNSEVLDGDSDEDWTGANDPLAHDGIEEKVFLDIPVGDDESNPGKGGDDADIAQYFLREENGTDLMCKKCDENKIQKIYRIKHGNLSVVYRHLKQKHGIRLTVPKKETGKAQKTNRYDTDGRRKKTYMRNGDHLYVLEKIRNSTEYWRCRDRDCCRARLFKKNGVYEEERVPHTCFITKIECDMVELKEKIYEAALINPNIPPAELIAKMKVGYPQEVLQELPPDESMSRCIRRKRQKAAESN